MDRTQLLQQRWEALERQIALIRQSQTPQISGRVEFVLDWLQTRMDELEIELGSMVTDRAD